MDEGAERVGDFEESAASGDADTRTETPLPVGVWMVFERNGRRVGRREGGHGSEGAEGIDGDFGRVADAAVPHARDPLPPDGGGGPDDGGERVAGEAGAGDDGAMEDEGRGDDGREDGGRDDTRRDDEGAGARDCVTRAVSNLTDTGHGDSPDDEPGSDDGGEVPVFPPVSEPFGRVDHPGHLDPDGFGHQAGYAGHAGHEQLAWGERQLPSGASVHPSPYPGFEAYASAFPSAAPAPGRSTKSSRRGRRADDGRRDDRDDRDVVGANRGAAAEVSVPRRSRGVFETVLGMGATAVVLVGLVLYFGWARSAAISDYLGFDEEVLGYSAQDYFVRGIDVLDRPLLAAFAVLLAMRMAHPRLVLHLRRHRRAAVRLSWALRCAWFAVPAAAWAAVLTWPQYREDRWPVLLPGALAVGVLVSAYGVLISRQLGAHRRETGMGVRPWSLSVVLTASTVVLCLFWALGAYAGTDGRATARRMVEELPTRTAVVVHSVRDLRVAGDQGVVVEVLNGSDQTTPEAYRYRYSGLRLLRHDDGRLYLLPDGWSWDRPRLVVIRAESGVRVDYLRRR